MWSMDLSEFLNPFQEIWEVKTIFLIMVKYLPFFVVVGICTDTGKAMTGKSTAQINTVTANVAEP